MNEPALPQQQQADLDEIERQRFEQRLGSSLLKGVLGGAIAGFFGAVAWAAITVATDHKIAWIAIGIGFIVGFGVRYLGKGHTSAFRASGAALALAATALGNFLTVIALVADHQKTGYWELISQLDADTAMRIMQATFDPMDLLFYGLAAWCGWKFAVPSADA